MAVIAVSGVHLPFMQVGAWGMMLWERESTGDGATLARAMGDIVTEGEPCQRCLITMRASLKAPSDSRDQKRPVSPETTELRLIPAHWVRATITPPSPQRLPRARMEMKFPQGPYGTPTYPPPEMGVS